MQRSLQHANHVFTFMLLVITSALFGGCSTSYSLEGRAVLGELSMVTFVSPDDPVLEIADAAEGARISLVRDPDRLNRKEAASVTSRRDGWFAMPVKSFGAGWMDERWEVQATLGSRVAREMIDLPGPNSDKIMLVIIGPGGPDGPDGSGGRGDGENLMQEYEKYKY